MSRVFDIFPFGIAAAIVALLIAGCVMQSPRPDSIRSVVELSDAEGLGSGVHIGHGYILTAAHVPGADKEMKVTASDGSTQTAEVLWTNKTYDIALLKVADTSHMASSRLSCRAPHAGDVVKAQGNPMGVQFLTSWGRVSGNARKWGPWKSVMFTDLTIAPGNSGGAVFSENGDVVGIAVGVMLAPIGYTMSMTGFSTVVPGSTVCGLLARTA